MIDIYQLFQKQKAYFDSGATRDITFRIDNLNKLKNALMENERDILDALREDLNKSPSENPTVLILN